jgi:hypothetical protein
VSFVVHGSCGVHRETNPLDHRVTAPVVVIRSLSMPNAKPERRSQDRVPARVPVSIKAQSGSVEGTGFTRDLSTSGIFIYTDSQISEGSELEMVLILPPELTHGEKQWVCCQAAVVRVEGNKDGGDFGVAASIRSIEVLPEIPS